MTEKKYKILKAKTVKSSDSKQRKFEAIITNDALDRDGEVLLPEGMDYSEFVKIGTIFYNHNYETPIGSALEIKKQKNAWISKGRIADRPKDYVGEFFPDFVWAMLEQGIVKGISVGFMPLDERRPTKKDFENYGDSIRNVITKWKLLEYSVAPLQANPEAIVTSIEKGLLSRSMAKKYFGFNTPTKNAELIEQVVDQMKSKSNVNIDYKSLVTAEFKKEKLRSMGKLYY